MNDNLYRSPTAESLVATVDRQRWQDIVALVIMATAIWGMVIFAVYFAAMVTDSVSDQAIVLTILGASGFLSPILFYASLKMRHRPEHRGSVDGV